MTQSRPNRVGPRDNHELYTLQLILQNLRSESKILNHRPIEDYSLLIIKPFPSLKSTEKLSYRRVMLFPFIQPPGWGRWGAALH